MDKEIKINSIINKNYMNYFINISMVKESLM